VTDTENWAIARNTEARMEVLAREVRAQRNSLMSAIQTRKHHPSYGYTKALILAQWNTVRGMAAGYAIMDGESSALVEFLVRVGLDRLAGQDGPSYDQITRAVNECMAKRRS